MNYRQRDPDQANIEGSRVIEAEAEVEVEAAWPRAARPLAAVTFVIFSSMFLLQRNRRLRTTSSYAGLRPA